MSPVGFTVALGLKDLGLAEWAAADIGTVLPSSPTLRSVFESALSDADLCKLDWSAVAEVTRRTLTLMSALMSAPDCGPRDGRRRRSTP